MKAIILAGGKGTRLAPYTTVFPKPLVPLGNKPILDIIIHQLRNNNINDITISLGYLAELIEAYIQTNAKDYSNVNISFIKEVKPLGTVGSLSLVPDLNDTFLVMNGDILTTLNYNNLIKYHKENGALLTIAMNKRAVNIDLGVLDLNGNQITQLYEKPTYHYDVSMGIYVYEPEILKYIPHGKYFDFPELVWEMLKRDDKIIGYPSDDYWLDLGSHNDYQKAQDEFESIKDKLIQT